MPVLREQDFDKMATQAVDRFLSGKTKLADAVAEEAIGHSMNPDQIERLTQAANTMTFLKMMDQRKQEGAGDLMHEFDPVDARQVIRIVIDGSGVHVNPGPMEDMSGPTDSNGGDELPNEMGGSPMTAPEPPTHEQTETPEEEAAEHAPPRPKNNEDKEPPAKKPTKQAAIMRARKLTCILEDQLKQAEWSYEEHFDTLVDRFRRVYNPVKYEEFEKDAMAEYGDSYGIVIINDIRRARKLPPLETSAMLEKTAALADRHISLESTELRLFEKLHKIAEQAVKLEHGITWVRKQCA